MTRIPFLDMATPYRELQASIDAAVHRVLESGWYIRGEEVRAFESEWAAYTGTQHCVGVSNGLDAMHLVLRAWDIGAGDEVIVPSNTYIATWLAVSYAGATIVPVEPDPGTFNIDPSRVEAAITPHTRAILAVHLFGQAADIDALRGIAARHDIRILEDAAQAHGARLRGRRAGSLGDATAWSFYPTKNLGAMGDGGAVTTDDAALAERIRVMANYGSEVKYHNREKGFNCRLDDLQAAILRAKLPVLDEWNDRRRAIARLYSETIHNDAVTLPRVLDGAEPVWHLYVIQSPRRDELQEALTRAGIGTLIHYPIAPFDQPAYAEFHSRRGEWPIAIRMAAESLSLPIGPHLSQDDAQQIADAISEAAAAPARPRPPRAR